ncbi:MAG TPA: tripartite tricarboxylate transporter substrate-binding protein [Stellaceae bacterium]|jgi:tripartite-type tricarboxylate transporter receptor subunit TctC|nr:tripartite tricarboxylate transporter substrate-binding protein [Stellaceae bacterium]
MRASVRLVLLLVALALGHQAAAAYPDRPIRIVVPFPANGPDDLVARIVAPELGKLLGQPITIDNIIGEDGIRGSDVVARAAPDGYTLLIAPSSHAIHPATYPHMPYDTETAFAPISLLVAEPYVLVVNPSLPVDTVEDLIGYAKAHPGKLSYASAGAGGPAHLGFELFKITTGTDIVHVPYDGGAPALAAVVADKAQMMLAPIIAAVPLMHDGKLRGLAVSSAHPAAAAPNLPTIAQTLPGFTAVAWSAAFAPAGTAKDIVDQLNKAFDRIVHEPAIAARFAAIGGEPVGGPPATLSALLHAEIPRWIGVAKEAGIHIN